MYNRLVIRDLGPVRLELVRSGGGLDLSVDYMTGRDSWSGVASFPLELEDEAVLWMNAIESENDIEDLMRQWAPEETWASFQFLRNSVGA